jgi:hypothetical protein
MGYQEQLEKSRGAALKISKTAISKTAISKIAISNSCPPFFELWQSNSWALGHVHIFLLAQKQFFGLGCHLHTFFLSAWATCSTHNSLGLGPHTHLLLGAIVFLGFGRVSSSK